MYFCFRSGCLLHVSVNLLNKLIRLNSLRVIIESHPLLKKRVMYCTTNIKNTIKDSIQNDDALYLKYLRNKGIQFDSYDYCNLAAAIGNISILKLLHDIDSPWWGETICAATINNHFEIAEYLIKNECPVDDWVISVISKKGTIQLMEALCNEGYGHNFNDFTARDAAEGENFEMVKYLINNRSFWEIGTVLKCMSCGRLDVFPDLNVSDYPLCVSSTYIAAYQKNIRVLQNLHNYGTRFSETTFRVAAEQGHLDVVKYLHKMNCRYGTYVSYCAAKEGHLHVLKFLAENGYNLDIDSAYIAAVNGRTETFKFLFDNNYIIAKECMKIAFDNGHLEIIKYVCDTISGSKIQ